MPKKPDVHTAQATLVAYQVMGDKAGSGSRPLIYIGTGITKDTQGSRTTTEARIHLSKYTQTAGDKGYTTTHKKVLVSATIPQIPELVHAARGLTVQDREDRTLAGSRERAPRKEGGQSKRRAIVVEDIEDTEDEDIEGHTLVG
ncbi:hypothetical protein B0T09DRAFT_386119 [Sordaria sp. MPI-SDFR-AT-0083]|nr:hypothetical protein B0T09DRAFT_386119 [Sordaria sp. MPI-SDFR-AT-0083]